MRVGIKGLSVGMGTQWGLWLSQDGMGGDRGNPVPAFFPQELALQEAARGTVLCDVGTTIKVRGYGAARMHGRKNCSLFVFLHKTQPHASRGRYRQGVGTSLWRSGIPNWAFSGLQLLGQPAKTSIPRRDSFGWASERSQEQVSG